MKQKFIEWFTKNNNGCSPAMEDDRSFVYEMTQHMFEAYQAGVAEGEARCAALAAENAGLSAVLMSVIDPSNEPAYQSLGMGCGVEDNSLQTDGYGACEYGWREAMERVYSEVIPEELPETPATDAFLAEVRAAAVDEVCLKISNAIINCYQDEMVGLDAAAAICGDFASGLRKGVQS